MTTLLVSLDDALKSPRTTWTPQTHHSPLQRSTFRPPSFSASSAALRRALPAAPPRPEPSCFAQSSAATSSTSTSLSFSELSTDEVTLPTPSRTPPRWSSQRSPATWPDLYGSPLTVILNPTSSPCFTLARPQPLLGRHGLSSPAYGCVQPPLRHSRRRAP